MKKIPVFAAVVILILMGCGPKNRLNVDVSAVIMPGIIIHRYDLDLFRIDRSDLRQQLEKLKPEYRFFLGTDLGDPGRLNEMKSYLENPRNIDFAAAVAKKYPDLRKIEQDLTEAFRHYRYYYPQAQIPRVYSYISGGDYEYPVQFADTVMLIGLDNYLGKNFTGYTSDQLPEYRLERTSPDHIVPDCMRVFANFTTPTPLSGNTLLDRMVEAGKRLYFIDAMIPGIDDRFKVGYSPAQYEWIRKNEAHVWAAIIENRMLYATGGQTIRIFMADGPFTAEFSGVSPARMGEWIGWQIVKKYMANHHEVTLSQLMGETDSQKILTLSKYKPQKQTQ